MQQQQQVSQQQGGTATSAQESSGPTQQTAGGQQVVAASSQGQQQQVSMELQQTVASSAQQVQQQALLVNTANIQQQMQVPQVRQRFVINGIPRNVASYERSKKKGPIQGPFSRSNFPISFNILLFQILQTFP